MRRLFAREFLVIFLPAFVIAVAASWFAFQYVRPAPPKSFAIAAASKGSPYYELARLYSDQMKQDVTVTVEETGGSFDNLKALRDPHSGVQAGLIQGGLTNKVNEPHLRSLGRLLAEPVWVFYTGPERIDRLTQLKGKRVLIGPAGGGVEYLARKLLEANGVTEENSTLSTLQMPEYVEAFASGKADAGFLVLGAEARTVQRLLRAEGVRLMSMSQADALTQRFPYLSKLTLRQGVVDFGKNIPPEDTVLVSTQAALVVRDDMHSALVNRLAQAVLSVQRQPTLTAAGDAKLFPVSPEALMQEDPEFPMAAEARLVYKSGPPFLQQYLPFWLATLLNRVFVLILPLLGVILPLIRLVPMIYNWRMRQRILYWYRQLRLLERGLSPSADVEVIEAKEEELARIEDAVSRMQVPLQYAADLFNLRDHVDLVRKRMLQIKERALTQQRAPTALAG